MPQAYPVSPPPERGGFASGRKAEALEIEALFWVMQCVDTEFIGSYTVPGSSLSRFEGGFV